MKKRRRYRYWLAVAAGVLPGGCVATGEPAFSSEDAAAAEKLRDDYMSEGLTAPDRNRDNRATRIPSRDRQEGKEEESGEE